MLKAFAAFAALFVLAACERNDGPVVCGDAPCAGDTRSPASDEQHHEN